VPGGAARGNVTVTKVLAGLTGEYPSVALASEKLLVGGTNRASGELDGLGRVLSGR
jgi:hypothetical protein